MVTSKLFFLLIIAICAAFYILYVWDFALVLLVAMIVLPIVMFLVLMINKRLISAEFVLKDDVVPKNQAFPVQLCINNRSIFPVGRAQVRIEYYNLFSNQISFFEMHVPIQSKNSQRITFQLSSKFCGILNIRSVYMTIYDPLKIFRRRIARNITAQVAVVPEIHDIGGTVSYTDRVDDESDRFSENKPGDDPSEVFDLREYIPGDKLNRIHWKLSSKKDDFIVKDYSLPIDAPSTLFLDLRCYEDSEFTLPVFDTLVETMLSISQFMLDNERSHTVIYYSGREHGFTEKSVYRQEDLAELSREMIYSFEDSLSCKAPGEFFSDNSLSLASFVFISSATDPSVLALADDSTDADFKNAVIVVKSPGDAAKLSAGRSDMNIIPVVIGRITSSIKDIEL